MGLQRFKLFTDGQNRRENQVKLPWFIEKTTSYGILKRISIMNIYLYILFREKSGEFPQKVT